MNSSLRSRSFREFGRLLVLAFQLVEEEETFVADPSRILGFLMTSRMLKLFSLCFSSFHLFRFFSFSFLISASLCSSC